MDDAQRRLLDLLLAPAPGVPVVDDGVPRGRATCPHALLAREGAWLAEEMQALVVRRLDEAWAAAGVAPPAGWSLALRTSPYADRDVVVLTATYEPPPGGGRG